MKIVSLFSGVGGLDLGFSKAGFDIIFSNEFDKDIWTSFEQNHDIFLDKRSIIDIPSAEIPECDGLIGGPPCQSWSAAGAHNGINDPRGQLFYQFIRVLRDKKPLFFLAENVAGMLSKRHSHALENIKTLFNESGYNLHFKLLNSNDYGVAQDRLRVFFIGFRNDVDFSFPEPFSYKPVLKDVIFGMDKPLLTKKDCLDPIFNHESLDSDFSSMYMSRNRVRQWHEPSFTIQAGGRHAPIHPDFPLMEKIDTDIRRFVPGFDYRRLSVRECARIQSFPDDFILDYKNILHGYKMIGNAVPPELAFVLASKIKETLKKG
jgi:DNA (cytosine-5)-methyltransferase 1